MNAGIVILVDGSPCIVYDEKLPYDIDYVEFNEDDHLVTLVYAIPNATEKQGHEFSYPLDRPFVDLLRERGNVIVSFIKNRQVIDTNICIVRFAFS
jgi:hypothetical protein